MAKQSFTADEIRNWKTSSKGRLIMPGQKEPSKAKYGNQKQPDPETGANIDSKLEARHRAEYRAMLRAGEIFSYSHQPEFILPGGVKYRGDHLIIHLDGTMEVIDSKGVETQTFRIKWKQVQELYPGFTWTLRRK